MHHSEWGIVNWFVRLAMESKPLTIYGTGSQKRDYVFVEDIADAFITTAVSPKTNGQIYNVGSGVGTPFIMMANTIASMIPGTVVQQLEWPADRYFVETGDYISDIRRLQKDTNWKPKIDFIEGIQITIKYYQKNREMYWI
jgi:UDP-glucose 4-epimerase